MTIAFTPPACKQLPVRFNNIADIAASSAATLAAYVGSLLDETSCEGWPQAAAGLAAVQFRLERPADGGATAIDPLSLAAEIVLRIVELAEQDAAGSAQNWSRWRYKAAIQGLLQSGVVGSVATAGGAATVAAAATAAAPRKAVMGVQEDLSWSIAKRGLGQLPAGQDARRQLAEVVAKAIQPASQQPGWPADPLFLNQRTVLLASRAGSLTAADLPGGPETAVAHIRALLAHPGRPHDVDLKLLDHYQVPAQRVRRELQEILARALREHLPARGRAAALFESGWSGTYPGTVQAVGARAPQGPGQGRGHEQGQGHVGGLTRWVAAANGAGGGGQAARPCTCPTRSRLAVRPGAAAEAPTAHDAEPEMEPEPQPEPSLQPEPAAESAVVLRLRLLQDFKKGGKKQQLVVGVRVLAGTLETGMVLAAATSLADAGTGAGGLVLLGPVASIQADGASLQAAPIGAEVAISVGEPGKGCPAKLGTAFQLAAELVVAPPDLQAAATAAMARTLKAPPTTPPRSLKKQKKSEKRKEHRRQRDNAKRAFAGNDNEDWRLVLPAVGGVSRLQPTPTGTSKPQRPPTQASWAQRQSTSPVSSALKTRPAMPIAPELALDVARRLPAAQWVLPRGQLEAYVAALRRGAQRTGHLGDDLARHFGLPPAPLLPHWPAEKQGGGQHLPFGGGSSGQGDGGDWLASLRQLAEGKKAAMEPAAVVRQLDPALVPPAVGSQFVRALLRKPRRHMTPAVDAAEALALEPPFAEMLQVRSTGTHGAGPRTVRGALHKTDGFFAVVRTSQVAFLGALRMLAATDRRVCRSAARRLVESGSALLPVFPNNTTSRGL
jgi:hypothetical protein